MAEYYQETLVVKADYKSMEDLPSALKQWTKCLVKFVTIKARSGILRLNFCTLPSPKKNIFLPVAEPSFVSIFIKRVDTIQLKHSTQSLEKSGPVQILSLQYENSRNEKCKIHFAFKVKQNFEIHQKIFQSFVDTLLAFKQIMEPGKENETAAVDKVKASKTAHNRSYRLAVRDLDEEDDADYRCDSNDRSEQKENRNGNTKRNHKVVTRLFTRSISAERRIIVRRRPIARKESTMPEATSSSDAHEQIEEMQQISHHQQWSLRQFLFKCVTPTKDNQKLN